MVVAGADAHKRTHTFVAVEEAGRELGHETSGAVPAGHRAAVMWARERFGAELRWATGDCRHLPGRLERDLLTAGQAVVRAVVREPGLRVHEPEPSWAPQARSLDLAKHQQILAGRLEGLPGLAAGQTAGVSRFRSGAAFTRHAGIAPIPAWSGRTKGRVRLTRSGNQQLNDGDPPHRRHPDQAPGPRQDLPREEESRTQVHPQGPALPQTAHRPHRLQPPDHRPRHHASHQHRPDSLT